MLANVGGLDRLLRVLFSFALLSFALFSGHPYSWIGYLGIVPLLTAITGFCPIYALAGTNSRPLTHM